MISNSVSGSFKKSCPPVDSTTVTQNKNKVHFAFCLFCVLKLKVRHNNNNNNNKQYLIWSIIAKLTLFVYCRN